MNFGFSRTQLFENRNRGLFCVLADCCLADNAPNLTQPTAMFASAAVMMLMLIIRLMCRCHARRHRALQSVIVFQQRYGFCQLCSVVGMLAVLVTVTTPRF